MDDIKSKVIGGAIVLVLGGTGFAVTQGDVVNNFAAETGMSQEQAQQYVEDSKDKLDSFGNIGKELVSSGEDVLSSAKDINCDEYTYEWETASLSCNDGKSQLQYIGSKEVSLGQCYKDLDTDLGSNAKTRINECIRDIDDLNMAYDKPAASSIFGNDYVSESKTTNLYNKSVLKSALESE